MAAIDWKTPAAAICDALILPPHVRALLTAEPDAQTFVNLLMEQGHLAEAARFLAFALPPRHAVWWGCLCVRHTLADSPAERVALRAAVELVCAPSEERKKACDRASQNATLNTPAGCLAVAAARWNVPRLRPGRPAGAAVLMSATRRNPVDAHTRQYLAIGLDVAADKLPWPKDENSESQ